MGKPMLVYAIEAANEAKIFDEIMVSTEDEHIAEIARQWGAKVPFFRTQKTADDYATTQDVLKEVLGKYRDLGENFDILCCIYPCVPFLTGEILRQAYQIFINSNAYKLIPVVEYDAPIQRAFVLTEDKFLVYREPENALKRSQDLAPTYHDVGMFYFYKLPQTNSKILPFFMHAQETQDIDTPEDWAFAELKYKVLHHA